jgi:hypothetical protein
MTQPLPERCEALRSLLPYLFLHLSLLPGASVTPRYGDSELVPGPPAPPWTHLDCDGLCPLCPYGKDCRGEGWERMERMLRVRYRMGDIRVAFEALTERRPWLARAVLLVYVDPADERSEPISEPAKIMRQRVANEGVEWMAGEIRGELVPVGEKPNTRANQIRQMAAQGYTWKRITKELRCSRRDVSAVLCVHESAHSG